MSKVLKPLLALTITAFMAACSTTGGKTKVCPPPEIVQVPVPYYVPVDESLTSPLPIAIGKLSEIPAVSRKRRETLEKANIDRAAVRKLQGSPVPAEAKP